MALVIITIDSVRNQQEFPGKYASRSRPDTSSWRFLTGLLDGVKTVCHIVGVDVWQEDKKLSHPLHTVVIVSHDKLVANFLGSEFSTEQFSEIENATLRHRSGGRRRK